MIKHCLVCLSLVLCCLPVILFKEAEMSVYAKAFLPLLLAALCACRVEVGHHDGEAASQAAAAAPVLQSVEVGKTTVEQIRALYPDAVKMEDGEIIFGNRRLGSESGAVEVYQSNVQNGFPLRMFAFDGESKLLQMMILARTDNEVATLVKDLEATGFAPYPHLSAEEFTVLNSGMFVTAEEREKFLAENGIQQFKRGSLLAFVFVRFYGYDFLAANASAKVINSTTNLAALTFFIPQGHVVWAWAIPLAVANLCGGVVGARLAIRGGTKLLRYGFMLLLCLTIGKFAWDLLG